MPAPKGIQAVEWLRRRTPDQRGGNGRKPEGVGDNSPDALRVWRESYLSSLTTRNYSVGTVASRRDAINQFLAWAAERELHRAGEITRPILESYQHWLWHCKKANGQRLGWSTQRNRLSILKDFFRWITRQNGIIHNPASELELPRMEKRLPPDALSQTEMDHLLVVPNVADPLGVRDRAMLELFYTCGLRRSELCRLELTDLNPERGTLHIRRGKGHKDRFVPVGGRALQWIDRYLKEVRPRLCVDTRIQALFLTGYGGPFNPDVLSRMVSTWLKQAGLKRQGCCHVLRYACASHMLENGADIRFIQQLLGHEKLDTTALYAQVSIKQLREVHARCHPAGAKLSASLTAEPSQNTASTVTST